MEIKNPLYISDRNEWRDWLRENFETENEAWLFYSKKSSGKQRILYNDAVEEALCFGWIDSTLKGIDNQYYAQRFTPRRKKSEYSQANKERLRWLAERNLLHPSVYIKVKHILDEKFNFPEDIIEAIRSNEITWKNYCKFSESYKRLRISYIETARTRPEEFKKRLENFINKTSDNKLVPGFGGIEKYY